MPRPSSERISEGHHLPPDTRDRIVALAEEYQFLHPHIVFPDVYEAGGFDVVVGNPPWGRIKLQEKKWFAHRSPEIASAPNKAARARLIEDLKTRDPRLYREFRVAKRHAERMSALIRNSGRYPLSAKGDINTYQIFADLMRAAGQRAGMIVPSGIASDHQTKDFFNDLVTTRSLVSLYDFENRKGLFSSVHRSYKFCLLTLTDQNRPADVARFVFFAHEVGDIDDREKNFSLTPEDLMLFNPNTRTAPTFRTRRDADITTGIYRRVPVLIREGVPDGNPWQVELSTMYHMSNDSGLFRTQNQLENDGWTLQGNHFVRDGDRYLPLYVLAMVHQYDHRWATFENGKVPPRHRCRKAGSLRSWPCPGTGFQPTKPTSVSETTGPTSWAGATSGTQLNARTFIMSPHPWSGVGNKLPQFVIPPESLNNAATLTAAMNSFAGDFITRQKLGGTTMNFFYVKQFAVLDPDLLSRHRPFIEPRIVELCYTAWDMAHLATSFGWNGSPFRWNSCRRVIIRAEIDALMFRLYGLDRPNVDYVMDTFDALRTDDLKQWGEYRTKRLVLDRYDAMAEAERRDQSYKTVLDPEPAHRSVATTDQRPAG